MYSSPQLTSPEGDRRTHLRRQPEGERKHFLRGRDRRPRPPLSARGRHLTLLSSHTRALGVVSGGGGGGKRSPDPITRTRGEAPARAAGKTVSLTLNYPSPMREGVDFICPSARKNRVALADPATPADVSEGRDVCARPFSPSVFPALPFPRLRPPGWPAWRGALAQARGRLL